MGGSSSEIQMKIKYVGKKDFAVDSVTGSGKCWNGAGDIQSVTDEQGIKLLKHPDEFAEVNADHSADGMAGDYADMTKDGLRDLCDELKLEYSSRYNKAALIGLVEAYYANQAKEETKQPVQLQIEDAPAETAPAEYAPAEPAAEQAAAEEPAKAE
jgi:hypothetical protein